jgi:4-hydroxy-tetrahydrodipicolinate synthase
MRTLLNGVGGSLTALATPFRDGQVDWKRLATLSERQITRGTAALIVCGSTGEAAALTQSEYGRAVLCAVPPYVKPTQDGIFAHVRAVAHETDLPIVLYDVPSRSAMPIADETIWRLHEAGHIVGLKDATADPGRPTRLRARCGERLMLWSGDDASAPAFRAMGGLGCISVTANVTPALCAAMHEAWDDGDLSRFAELRDLLDPLNAALFVESNPIPVKAALASIRLCTDEVRLPLTRATIATVKKLETILATIMPAEEEEARRFASGIPDSRKRHAAAA